MHQITAQAPLPVTGTVSGRAPDPVKIAEALTTEAPKVEPPKEEEALSAKYAAFARKEKQIREMQRQIQLEKEELKKKHLEYETNYIPKSRLTAETMAVLNENGIGYDKLTEIALNAPSAEAQMIQRLEQKIAQLEAKTEVPLKKMEEQQTAQYEQAVEQIRSEAISLVASNADYETIKETNSAEAVVELIKQTFDSTGKILSVDEAAKQVEDYLVEEYSKMAGLKKVQAKLSLKSAETVEGATLNPQSKTLIPAQTSQNQTQIKTLTNAAMSAPSKALTSREKRERAILAFKGQL